MTTSLRLQSGSVIKLQCAHCGNDQSIAALFSDEWLGTAVWPAARVLVDFMEKHRSLLNLPSLSIIELGSGTGVCGLAAAALGAAQVTLTDQSALLRTLAHNICLNSLGSSVACRELTWSTSCLPHDVFHDGADLVLMSDCLNSVYGDQHALALAATLHCLLKRKQQLQQPADTRPPSPLGLLSQARRGSGQAEDTFFSECARIGLTVQLVETSFEPFSAVLPGGSISS
jgi:hypothetical protein